MYINLIVCNLFTYKSFFKMLELICFHMDSITRNHLTPILNIYLNIQITTLCEEDIDLL